MYSHNRIGPWPVLDPSIDIDVIDTSSAIEGVLGTFVSPYLGVTALGGKSSTSVHYYFDSFDHSVKRSLSFGIALPKLREFSGSNFPIYIDYSFSTFGRQNPEVQVFPFIVQFEADVQSGFNSSNETSKYHVLPSLGDSGCGQVLLSGLLSGSLDEDSFYGFGVMFVNATGVVDVSSHQDISLSARYAVGPIVTQDRLR